MSTDRNQIQYIPPSTEQLKMVLNDERPLKILNAYKNTSAALMRLANYDNTFIYIIKYLDPKISQYLTESSEALDFYYTVQDKRTGIKFSFAIIYIIIVTLLLFLSISIAIRFSSRFFLSINNLISASTNIGKGNLNSKVPEIKTDKELEVLNKNFNQMIDRLKYQQNKLIANERHEAWESVARKIAHEIKNPLTPMRLTVQSFQKNSGLKGSDQNGKLNDFCDTLIEQIDTMSNVATSFSDFATLPKTQLEKTDIVDATKKVVEIFEQNNITLETSSENIFVKLDKEQWIRVMTNLIKNSIQAIPHDREPLINVKITENSKTVKVMVSDNGLGVSKINRDKIFEPKFTTKSDGMGLGLGIVRSIINSHRGKISYKSKSKKGTDFKISLPK